MKIRRIIISIVSCVFLMSTGLISQDMSFMTFNIRYANQNDGDDRWDVRKNDVAQLIQHYQPDAMGIQEGLHPQVTFLKEQLPSYKMIGVARDDGMTKGEYSSIFYDTTKLVVVEEGTFWLSETPDDISVGWDASMERICTYGLFRMTESGKKLYGFNAHFDHRGPQARLESAKLIMAKINELNEGNYPVILLGDLNATPEAPPIIYLREELIDPTKEINLYGPAGTWNGFDSTSDMSRRIDYIFTKGGKIHSYRHIDDRRSNGRMPSDHLPVIIKIKY